MEPRVEGLAAVGFLVVFDGLPVIAGIAWSASRFIPVEQVRDIYCQLAEGDIPVSRPPQLGADTDRSIFHEMWRPRHMIRNDPGAWRLTGIIRHVCIDADFGLRREPVPADMGPYPEYPPVLRHIRARRWIGYLRPATI